ncbi:MAG: hypothetical protein LIO51_06710 [Clostridiales bacterium]|nr:hypothetical protein [Clostridiales bacterium]
MFSSSELIHFVFANDSDIYCCGGLLQLGLEQYLWLRLHEQYQAVYFLHAGEQTFSIRTYGDVKSKPFETSWWTQVLRGTTEAEEQGKWLVRQLKGRQGETAAFVCPLGEFCTLLSSDEWRETLEQLSGMERRTGIIVLTAPVTAEGSRGLLLTSPVFDRLRETAVTDARVGGERELYSSIQSKKPDSVVYLNEFTRERVRDLLLRLSFVEGRYLSRQEADTAAAYLALYLNCSEIRQAKPLFGSGSLSWNFQYRELYDHLRKEDVWDCLLAQSRQVDQAGGLSAWLSKTGLSAVSAPPGILWGKNSYADRCLRLTVPERLRPDDAAAKRISAMMREIRKTVRSPRNRLESPAMVREVERLLRELDGIQTNGYVGTYERMLYALQFCVRWVYVRPDSESEKGILQITEKLWEVIRLSREYERQRSYLADVIRSQTGNSSLTDKTIEQSVDRVSAMKQVLDRYEDAVKASILRLTLGTDTGNIRGIVQRLEQELEAEKRKEKEREKEKKRRDEAEKEKEKREQAAKSDVNWDVLLDARLPE